MECRPCAISSHHVKSHKQHKRIEEEEQEQENQMQANVYLVCEERRKFRPAQVGFRGKTIFVLDPLG